MSALAKPGSPSKSAKSSRDYPKSLPSKSALMQLTKGPKTINNYSKAGPSIVQNGPTFMGTEGDGE